MLEFEWVCVNNINEIELIYPDMVTMSCSMDSVKQKVFGAMFSWIKIKFILKNSLFIRGYKII